MDPSPEELERRRRWFKSYMAHQDSGSADLPSDSGPYRCPCCGCRTLSERGGYDICPVCYWEDDGQDDQDADVVRGGPNGALSLSQARVNYRTFGACDQSMLDHVRPPLPAELPEK
jgi:hypothetical protein